MQRLLPLVLATGCAGSVGQISASSTTADAEPPPVELVLPHGVPGEVMEYEASLVGIPLGRVVVAVGQVGWIEGRRAIIVRARGQSTGLAAAIGDIVWEQEATLDVERGHAIRGREEWWAKVAGESEHEARTLDDEGEHDLLSAVGATRAWRSSVGQRAMVSVKFGGDTMNVNLVDAEHAFLASAGKPAVRYVGTTDDDEDEPFTAWISDDTARVPLRFEATTPIGAIVIDLVDYRIPRD